MNVNQKFPPASPALKGMAEAARKYGPYPAVGLKDRTWPDRRIEQPPIWCSVDLRDGNQALIDPMGQERKSRMFRLLLDMGFPEIEIGFPSASQTDFDFARWAIEEGGAPDDVSLQVLVQCRPELIRRTFEALEGARKPIVHFYNSTSELQRRVVFERDVAGVKQIATDAAKMITDMAAAAGGGYRFEYSPESFTGTELGVALEICNAVIEIVKPTPDNRLIVNLPATVEMSTPNIHADQIEWMCRNLDGRENLLVSLHPHNDRGTAVAAAELGLMAGADRVEGTLFGNGERTGNVDLVTMALNMLTQGVDPGLDCSDINRIKAVYEHCNQLRIPERHPYVGELVYTAFSGSHQDAINKGMKAYQKANKLLWEVPYLPIDPRDVGRTYEAIIRINSQSGKGGIAYVLQADYGLNLPRNLQIEFSGVVQGVTDREGRELPSQRIHELFLETYVEQPGGRLKLIDHAALPDPEDRARRLVEATIRDRGRELVLQGSGTGPVDAFVIALNAHLGLGMSVRDYSEHSLQRGSDAAAVSYMEIEENGRTLFGVGVNTNIVAASLEAVVSAANRFLAQAAKAKKAGVSAASDEAERPTVLCLHGFGGLGAAWAPVAARLPAGAAVLAPDLPGHGRAEAWDGRAPAKAFAEAALAELGRHGVEAAHWVGHSLGGAAATLAALAAPERVLSLTLLAPGGMGEAISSQRLRRWAEARNEAEIKAAFAGMAAEGAVLPSAMRAALARDRQEPGRIDALLGMAEKLSAGGRQGVFPPERLQSLLMPVSVLWGEADPVLPFGQATGLPPSWTLAPLPGRGHMLLEEAPFEAAKLLTFLLR